MPNTLQTFISALDLPFSGDEMVANVLQALFKSGLTRAASPLVSIIRRQHGGDLVGSGKASKPDLPRGPFRRGRRATGCDLLIFVPVSLESFFIDDVTGGYGYSHVAVDFGEVEVSTGKRVMTEATMGVGTHRSYQDTYGPRPFVRVPLAELGLDCGQIRDCVQDKLGEPYGYAEALTWAKVDDPAKQICTDLVANCLPTKMRVSIAGAARTGRLGRHTVSVHGPATLPLHIFVSPNGFARYFGAARGHKVHRPDQLVHPRLRRSYIRPSRVAATLLVGLGIAAGLWIGWKLLRRSPNE